MNVPQSPDMVRSDVFESLYRAAPDPWNFAHSDYEQGRYQQILEALLRPRYERAFEPGCSVGELTVQLARRCGMVIATEIIESAVRSARLRCRHQLNVSISQRNLAEGVSAGPFDLVILSEVGYYFSRPKLGQIAREIAAQLTPGGELLAAHWLGSSPDHLLHGDEVHRILAQQLPLRWVKGGRMPGFRLDTWVAS